MGPRRGIAALLVAVLGAAALVQPACARQDAPAGPPDELYRTGQYESAVRALGSPADAAARRLLVRALMEVGRYDDAVAAALNGLAPDAVPVELANVAGEALAARGRRAEAESLFARAAASLATSSPVADALTARLNLALSKWDRGARAEALRELDGFIDIYNSGRARTADDLTAVATAVSRLGVTNPQLFHDARRAYEEAAALDARNAEPKLLEGALFLEKYNSTDATALFREVLAYNPRHPRALLGLARAKAFDGTGEALALVDSSLAVNTAAPAARAFRARLLLGLEEYDDAATEAQRALDVDPTSLEALSMLGAVHYLRGDRSAYDAARRQALALDPHFGAFDVLVAEMASQQRRYRDAVDLARAGLARDSLNWGAHALIGLTELRLGNVAAARAGLEAAFRGDPYNVWVMNTLDLLDTYPQYVTHHSDRFELFLHGDEADLLGLYMTELAEEAYETLSQRYGARPDVPVRVEVYPSHADFSVRTVGLAGLGALGVAFGNVLALDSPSARDAGSFNWGSTLWHEIAHAVTLAASDHRVPRWLTEGISVLEERRAREGWGEGVSVGFLAALKTDRLLPVSELNTGFVRPTYPQQVMHAYYQASLVAELIEQEHGSSALRDMLRAYRAGRSTEQVFRDVLGTDLAAFDRQFERHMRERFSRQLGAIDVAGDGVAARLGVGRGGDGADPHGAVQVAGAFLTTLRNAQMLLEAGRLTDARREAERARDLFPEYAAPDGPYRVLHQVHLRGGDTRAAAAALAQHVAYNEKDYDAHIQLADLYEELDDATAAAAVLERAMYISPFDPAVHDRMARLYEATGQHRKLVRERRAVLALDPVNRADALYRLALALELAGDTAEARRQVVRALEIAPNFDAAQQLLLRLTAGRS
jgi:cellulose synthase operon protein C